MVPPTVPSLSGGILRDPVVDSDTVHIEAGPDEQVVTWSDLSSLQDELVSALQEADFEDVVQFRRDERGLVVALATDDVVFQTGSAVLHESIAEGVFGVRRWLNRRSSAD